MAVRCLRTSLRKKNGNFVGSLFTRTTFSFRLPSYQTPERLLKTIPMMTIRSFPWLVLIAIALTAPSGLSAQTNANSAPNSNDQTEAERSFSLKLLPLLKAKCFGCHGNDPDDIQGDYDVRSREATLKGGESEEAAIIPGKPDESPFLLAVKWEDLEMPPKENDRLTPAEIELVENWIVAGAPWPDEATQKKFRDEESKVSANADGVLIKHSGGLDDEWTYRRYAPADVWAFMPVKKFSAEETNFDGQNPVDFFVNKRLAESGFKFAPAANPLTLIRRATYDLTGLPPTPEEIAQFTTEDQADAETAWSALIDRLLSSQRYGERWGQHWLDIARYADTGGFSNDYERSNAWRYRDYVIRSFNEDKPYDEFVIEQIAGDELADQSVRQRLNNDEDKVRKNRLAGDFTPQESQWLVASGFLRMGPWDNAMVEEPEARQMYLDDVVNSVGQTFLATTMRCFKCHDHKFDPLPTRDYYRMYAAFAGTQMAERPVPFTDQENQSGFNESKEYVETMLAYATEQNDELVAKRESAARRWYEDHGEEYLSLEQRKNLPDEEKPARDIGLDHVEQGQLKVREQDVWIWTRRLERYEPLAQSVYNAGEAKLAWNGARKLRIAKEIDPGMKPKSVILMGGALTAEGDPVGPGVLSALGVPTSQYVSASTKESKTETSADEDPYLLTDELEGRRLQLANWIVDPNNPLTSRTIVNRVWQYHFVNALARNPNNFGVKGKKPTHPELLDWLADDLVAGDWKLKRIHRMLMMSQAYRQSATHPKLDELMNKDPENELLTYFPTRRLSAEELRDSFLAFTGELNLQMGGLPIRPEINMEVALQPRMIQSSLAPSYQPSPTPEQRNRRTIYAYRVRGQADPFLELFNRPNPNESCEIRDSASVSPQVFSMLNSDVITDRSIAFAKRLQREEGDLTKQISRAFELVLGRQPVAAEVDRMTGYVDEMCVYHQDVKPDPPVYPKQITRTLVEEFSGQPFSYVEILPVFADYQPDLKPSDVDPETRALADFCLLLFNANEFMYVY